MSKRFERLGPTYVPQNIADHVSRMNQLVDAHSEAIEGLEERTDKLGRNLDMVERKLIAVDAALTERVAALESRQNDHDAAWRGVDHRVAAVEREVAGLRTWLGLTVATRPTPEPVVVEGEVVAMTRNHRKNRWELVVEAYHPRLQRGDRLTIERVEE